MYTTIAKIFIAFSHTNSISSEDAPRRHFWMHFSVMSLAKAALGKKYFCWCPLKTIHFASRFARACTVTSGGFVMALRVKRGANNERQRVLEERFPNVWQLRNPTLMKSLRVPGEDLLGRVVFLCIRLGAFPFVVPRLPSHCNNTLSLHTTHQAIKSSAMQKAYQRCVLKSSFLSRR